MIKKGNRVRNIERSTQMIKKGNRVRNIERSKTDNQERK